MSPLVGARRGLLSGSRRSLLVPSASLVLWLDAARLTASDGTAISTWADSSGNGREATQSTAASRPTVQTVSSRRVVRLDGVNDYLQVAHVPTLNLTGDYTIFLVCAPTSVAATEALFVKMTPSGIFPGYVFAFADSGYLYEFVDFTGGAEYEQLSASANQPFAQISAGAFSLIGFERASGTARIRVNGRPGRFRAMSAPDAVANPLLLGIDADGVGYPFGGDWGEFLLYNRALTQAERLQVENYLSARWGITLADRALRASAPASITDTFTNANGTALATHDAAWTATVASWEIQSNAARTTAVVDSARAIREASLTDLEVSATITTPALPGVGKAWFFGILARYTDANNYVYARYLYDATNPEVEVWQVSGGVTSQLFFGLLSETNVNELAAATAYELALQCVGSTVRAYHRGELVGIGTTAVLSGTQVGMGVWAGAGEADGRASWDAFTVRAA